MQLVAEHNTYVLRSPNSALELATTMSRLCARSTWMSTPFRTQSASAPLSIGLPLILHVASESGTLKGELQYDPVLGCLSLPSLSSSPLDGSSIYPTLVSELGSVQNHASVISRCPDWFGIMTAVLTLQSSLVKVR